MVMDGASQTEHWLIYLAERQQYNYERQLTITKVHVYGTFLLCQQGIEQNNK